MVALATALRAPNGTSTAPVMTTEPVAKAPSLFTTIQNALPVPVPSSPTSATVKALPASTPSVDMLVVSPPPAPLPTSTLPPALASTVDALHQVAAVASQSGDAAAQQVAQYVGNLANTITSTAQQVQGADVVVGVTPTPNAAFQAIIKSPITWVVVGGLVLLAMRGRR